MIKRFRQVQSFPWYLWLGASYPIWYLYAQNISQIDPTTVMPIWAMTMLIISVVFLGLFYLTRDEIKAAVIVGLLATGFFTYGHFYNVLAGQVDHLPSHTAMIVGYGLLLLSLILLALQYHQIVRRMTNYFNIVALLLVIFPLVNIMSFHIQRVEGREINLPEGMVSRRTNPQQFPDIYYIFMDAYGRNDWLMQEFGYDNSAFTDALRERGFYVAERSCSNYTRTVGSISSALLMNFHDPTGLEDLNRWEGEAYLVEFAGVNNQIAKIAKDLGYTYIHFSSGFLITNRNQDADRIIDFGQNGAFVAEGDFRLNFMEVFLPTTMLRPVHESIPHEVYYLYDYQRVLLQFEELRKIPKIKGPTFTFVHFLKPHFPWAFDREGNIVEKPEGWVPEDDLRAEDRSERYIDQIVFMNREILRVIDYILRHSERTPIIIIQSDHSWRADDWTSFPILNAYLVPAVTREALYPSISPVNSFRLLYDTYWGLNLGLLDDLHYAHITKNRPFQFRPANEEELAWCE